MDYDSTQLPDVYDRGRSYRPEVLRYWLHTISSAIGKDQVDDILDLGCGTGRFSGALAEHFGSRVIALEPSQRMLAIAREKASAGVTFLHGKGEAIPLPSAAVDLVFMSMVFHHFEDPKRVVRECSRVLRDGGTICMRAGVAERTEAYPFVRFFPGVEQILHRMLQSVSAIQHVFFEAGFALASHEVIQSEAAESWHSYAHKLAQRADSALAQLDDGQFERGLRGAKRYAATAPASEAVFEPVDLFVFRKT
jgi:ubiquinone/menaquinone biosynthesis C-methylase UbiE